MSKVTGFPNTQKIKEEAASWLILIEEESPLPQEKVEALKDWVNTSDVHRQVIKQMSRTWGDMDLLAAVAAPEKNRRVGWKKFENGCLSVVLNMLGLITLVLSPLHLMLSNKKRASFTTLCLLLMTFLLHKGMIEPDVIVHNKVFTTTVGEQSKHVLPDGSKIWLNSNTEVELVFSDKFRRINLIDGEAHFIVEHDTERPFEVYANDRLVRALGTAFSVYRLKDRIEVLVSEGKVELAIVDQTLHVHPDSNEQANQPSSDSPIIELHTNKPAEIRTSLGVLVAGQSLSIPALVNINIRSTQQNVVAVATNDIVRKLSWLDGKLIFTGESLEEVVAEVSRHTPIRIDVPDPALRKLRIGGHFEAGETEMLFHVLESGFGIEVLQVSETHVELHVKK